MYTFEVNNQIQKDLTLKKWSKYSINLWNTWYHPNKKTWVTEMSWDASQLADCVNVWLFISLAGQTALHVFSFFFSSLLLSLLLLLVLGLAVGGCGHTDVSAASSDVPMEQQQHGGAWARARLPPFAAAAPPEESSTPLPVHMLTAPLLQLILGRNGDKSAVMKHQTVWPSQEFSSKWLKKPRLW